MKILVTGAGGFLGSAVCRELHHRGHQVVGLRKPSSHRSSPSVPEQMSWLSVDLFSPDMEKVLKEHRFEGLIHLAWITTPGEYWNSPSNLQWVSRSLEILEQFRVCGGKRVVIAGTSAEYSWGSPECLDEKADQSRPQGLYGSCKLGLMYIAKKWAEEHGISLGWGRIFNIYGPYEHRGRLIPRTIMQLLKDESIRFDSGTATRDFMHVDDAGAAFCQLFDSEFSGVVNIASGSPIQIKDLVMLIARILSKEKLLQFSDQDQKSDAPDKIVADVTILLDSLNYSRAYDLEDGLQHTCSWWQKQLFC